MYFTIMDCLYGMVFQIALRSGGEFPPLGGSEIFSGGREGLSGGGNLRKSDFDHSNISQSQKQLSVNIEH